ncbi:MAG TPA: heme lyase CcmF/NrfE family subunit [Xanthomonadaceae bacterium]|nr:heme lyase CcmF/NrfE family subunit [Xanthomonadaceae bacterium]
MLPELGQLALILALLVAVVQAVLPLMGAHAATRGLTDATHGATPDEAPVSPRFATWMRIARPAAYLQLALVAAAFVVLTQGFVSQDFSLRYVAANSNSLLPVMYRYSAVWGAHEGSLLLWALILAVWTAAVARFSRRLPLDVVARVLGSMGVISIGFLSFRLFTSNPFARLLPAAVEGRDLNPLLQDPGLIIHPPMLYLGYVGFAVPFAFAIAALLDGRVDARMIRWTRPWTNLAWACLTLGIALGSWWAYYELGWGGWWFWDPVENASFMPWLAGAALLHSQAVTEKRGSFRGWTLLLAIATFSLSLLGTFLVRSGVLTSVHAFAADPSRGLFILIFLGAVIGGSLLLYALRAPRLETGAGFAPMSRETLLLGNNLLLTTACAMVLLGTLYPLLADALGLGKVSVGPPYFALLFVLLMAPLVLLLPFGPLTRWQREQPSRPLAMLLPWAGLALGAGAAVFFLSPVSGWKTAAGVAASLWIVGGTLRFLWSRRGAQAGGRWNAELLGMSLAHLGVAVFLVGALLTEALSRQREVALRIGDSVELGRHAFRLDSITRHRGPNFVADRAGVVVLRDDRALMTLHPEKRAYASGGQVLTEAAIDAGFTRDLYVALGESLGDGAWAVRVHVKPFVRWIWLGALLMAAGGLLSILDRRYRREVGA